MGAICGHISHSAKKRASFIQDTESIPRRQRFEQNLDLPYRHYINKYYYIPSALPHSLHSFSSNRKIKISENIEQSSIIQRRIYFHNHDSPLFLNTAASISS